MKIIPAIDIIDGKCVRLSQGNYNSSKIYFEDPVEAAKMFEAAGIQYLHVVDLDGAKARTIKNLHVLENICKATKLNVDFGGGIQQKQDIENAINAGAAMVTLGSIAAKEPASAKEWLDYFGEERIILGADAHNRKIMTQGWTETTGLDVIKFIKEKNSKGFHYCICTDTAKDGMLAGPAFDLYKEILNNTSVQLIASGGVSSMQDLIELKAIGCHGAIIGKAYYEGHITLKELGSLC